MGFAASVDTIVDEASIVDLELRAKRDNAKEINLGYVLVFRKLCDMRLR
jgi:hypothetical protein